MAGPGQGLILLVRQPFPLLVRRLFRAAGTLGGLACLVARLDAQAASNEFWRAQSIYQIITDRFFDGDPANNNAEANYRPASSGSVHGGDFRGIERKLDYIKALGATAIWISPIVLNGHGQFHGYAGRDFYRVAPHWGSLSDLQHMVAAAHARGLLVIGDVVVNHGDDLIIGTEKGYPAFRSPPSGYTLKYRDPARTYAPPFDGYNAAQAVATNALTNLFHNYGAIPDYNQARHYELGELCGLDDFRTESAYVRSNMAAIYIYWIHQAGFDGYRVDTVKHVEMGFWQDWVPAVRAGAAAGGHTNFFLFGEVYDGSEGKCGSYTGGRSGGPFLFDSVLDYPLYFMVNPVFASGRGNTRQLQAHYAAVGANYDPSAQMELVTFLDNHDQPRFLSVPGATPERLNVALAFLFTARGIPCLYYGTEQAFNGSTDPNDREDMFAGQFEQGPSVGDNFNMTHPQYQMVARLNNFRRLYPALQRGIHVDLGSDPGGPGLFAYARRLDGQEVLVVLNTSSAAKTLPGRPTLFPAGARIVNLFGTNEVLLVSATRELPAVTVPGPGAKVFVAQRDWKPLDPTVVSNFPPHDAHEMPGGTPVTLRFSEAMDTNCVQAAFSTTPRVAGTFAWSDSGDAVTFTPGGGGFEPSTTICVRVSDAAIAAGSRLKLHSPYEMTFKTATRPAAPAR